MIGGRLVVAFCCTATLFAPLAAQQPSTGTAQLSGVILIEDGGRSPVRGAIVTISAPELSRPRSVITDAAGAFAFANLPAGRYTVTATKVPFLSMTYGATRPGRLGTSIRLGATDVVKDLVLRLPRGGVITGTIRDPDGSPLDGITLSAIRPGAPAQNTATPQLPSATTDDRGVYRIFGLTPGDYYVAATFFSGNSGPITSTSEAEMDRRLSELRRGRGPGLSGVAPVPGGRAAAAPPAPAQLALATTFYPGTTDASAATMVAVAGGEERTADFVLGPVRAGVVEGIIRTADGSAIPGVPATSGLPSALLVALDPMGPELPFMLYRGPTLQLRPSSTDPRFRFGGVTPGKYVLSATSTTRAGISAVVDVVATGDDITGLTLTLDRGPNLSGTAKFAGTIAPPAELTKIRLSITSNRPVPGLGLGPARPQTGLANLAADGSFEFRALTPATYVLEPLTIGGWSLTSAIINGREALDSPFDVVAGADISGATFTFSDTHTELSGTLRTGSDAPGTEFFVVAFPVDRSKWGASRRKQSTRPASDGVYSLKDLAPGEYYLAALTDVTADDLKDPAFLAQMVPTAIKVMLADGEKKTQDLRVGR